MRSGSSTVNEMVRELDAKKTRKRRRTRRKKIRQPTSADRSWGSL
jgi:hypothetical protein